MLSKCDIISIKQLRKLIHRPVGQGGDKMKKKMVIIDRKKIVTVRFQGKHDCIISVDRKRDGEEMYSTTTKEFSLKLQGDGQISREGWPEKKDPMDFVDEVLSGDTITVYSGGTFRINPSFFSQKRRDWRRYWRTKKKVRLQEKIKKKYGLMG